MKNKDTHQKELPIWPMRDVLKSAQEEARKDAKETTKEFREIIHDRILELTNNA